jgi:riboflavin kinase/FMN adenylyltransferase
LIAGLGDLPDGFRAGAVSIGNFDGVHRGHAALAERLVSRAAELGGPSVVFTFDPRPSAILRPDQIQPPLTTTEYKAELLGRLGVECVLAFPTTAEFLLLSAEDYFNQIIRDGLKARCVVEGPNFCFGRGRRGDVYLLAELCRLADIDLEVVPPVILAGDTVSSSRVRSVLTSGSVELAAQMLARPYRLSGRVTRGVERGRSIGFPTANLAELKTLIPAPGVYAGWAYFQDEKCAAAIHIGPNLTFNESDSKVEVHLIDWSGSLYGESLAVDFLSRLRDIRKFSAVNDLVAQLHQDVADARLAVGQLKRN